MGSFRHIVAVPVLATVNKDAGEEILSGLFRVIKTLNRKLGCAKNILSSLVLTLFIPAATTLNYLEGKFVLINIKSMEVGDKMRQKARRGLSEELYPVRYLP